MRGHTVTRKYGYMGTEGWAFPVPSCKHTTGTPVLGWMRGSHSTHACNALASAGFSTAEVPKP